MMTWSSYFFHNPSSFLMESVVLMYDYVTVFLIGVSGGVVFSIVASSVVNNFNNFFTENHELEIIWTLIPFFLLMFIILPSLETLYSLDSCMFCGITISIMGHQWFWSYFYKDFDNFFFDSYMSPSDSSSLRLLDVDNRLVIPSSIPIRVLVSSSDVIHSWSIPSLGLKLDAIPGRLNQFCFSSNRSGVFFGQCSEICGANHSFMPIVLESLSAKDFTKIF